MAAFDLETTGTDTESDRIVTASVILVGKDVETESHEWLVDPGIEIPAVATRVHGVTTERARAEGGDPAVAVEEITSLLARYQAEDVPIVAFNARFDLTMLDREARRYGIEPLEERLGGVEGLLVVDPLVLDKQCHRFRSGKRTLVILCEAYGIKLEEAHQSHADALAAARLAWKQVQAETELAEYDLPTLHESQVVWAAEQAASLEAYFREKGRDETVEQAWPVVPIAA
jgi:DNA polymerase-3 subunit epsilon